MSVPKNGREDGATHAYIGVKQCGCVVAATVDADWRVENVAENVAEFIKSGLKVERVTLEHARKLLKPCRCKTLENPTPKPE